MNRCLIALLIIAVAPLSVIAQPLADRLPADTLFYAGWSGTDSPTAGYEGSHLKAVIDASNYAKFVNEFIPAVMQRIAQEDRQLAQMLPTISTIGSAVWRHPTALYFGGMDFPAGGREPQPHMAILCDAGADSKALLAQVNVLLSQIPPGAPVAIGAKDQGGLVLITVGPMTAAFEKTIGGTAKADSLATDKKFVAAFAQTQPDPVIAVYADFEGVTKMVETGLAATSAPEDIRSQWTKVRDFTGIKGLTQLALAAGFQGKEWSQSAFLGAPAPRTGLVAMANGSPLAADALNVVPKSATWAAAGKFSMKGLFAILRGIAAQAPDGLQEFDNGIKQMSQGFGLDVEKDFIGMFGDDWVVYSDPNTGGEGILGMVLVNHLADAAKAETNFTKVEQLIFQILRANMSHAKVQINMLQQKSGDVTLHYLAVPLVSPTWAVKDGNLYIGLYPQMVAAGADFVSSHAPSVMESEAFKSVAARLAAKAGNAKFSEIEFYDLPRSAPQGYGMLVAMSHAIGFADLMGVPSPAMLLPPLNKIMPHLTPAGAATWSDDAGLHGFAVSPFPGGELLGTDPSAGGAVFTGALATSILLPSLSKARETANRVKCSANLRSIGQGLLLYANDNQGKYPPDLGTLVTGDYITVGVVICPSGNTQYPSVKREEQAAWVNANSDYVYLGAGKRNNIPADVIVCYEKNNNHKQGMCLLFGDGHVDFIYGAEAQRLINEQQKPQR